MTCDPYHLNSRVLTNQLGKYLPFEKSICWAQDHGCT